MNLILARILIGMVLTAALVVFVFGIWKQFFEPKADWSNYNWEETTKP